MFITTNKKIFFLLSSVFVGVAIASIALFGLKLGIEFTGGSTLEISYEGTGPSQTEIEGRVTPLFERQISVRPAGDDGYIIQTPFIQQEMHGRLLEELSFGDEYAVIEERFSSVGPVIGDELAQKALIAMSVVVAAIILFVAFSFRRGVDEKGNPIQEGVSSWFYGIAAIIALVFDMLLPTGLFAILGVTLGAEVDVLFVTALLAILGFSVNDTIVVFDRIRENLRSNRELKRKESFEETVGKSLEQSFARSINTSITTAVVLLALFFFGGSVTHAFSLTLLVGVIAGTYSSLFLASPLLIQMQKWAEKRKMM